MSLIIIISGSTFEGFAQISNGGTPYSTMFQVDNHYQHLNFIPPNINNIIQEDLINETANPKKPRRMGVAVSINKSLLNSGTWTIIPDVGKICRMQIRVDGALALGVYFDNFYIPEGGELFLYNHNKTQTIGAFTSNNNPDSQLFFNTIY